jgi:hypothetical protein
VGKKEEEETKKEKVIVQNNHFNDAKILDQDFLQASWFKGGLQKLSILMGYLIKAYLPHSESLNSILRILPLMVLGSSFTYSIFLGYL